MGPWCTSTWPVCLLRTGQSCGISKVITKGCRGNVRTMPQTAIQALDVAVRQSVYMHPTAIALARAVFFPDPRTIFALPNGAEASRAPLLSLSFCV